VASAARNVAPAVLPFGVACLIGFRPHAGLLGGLAASVRLACILVISWLAAAAGLLA
jgi:hypothetical protein